MQLEKTIVSVVLVASLAHANLWRNVSFRKEKPHVEDKQSVVSDFESVASAAVLSRENHPGRKASDRTGLPKPPAAASDMLFAADRFFFVASRESSRIITNGLTLVSLHCQLTV